MQKRSLLRFGGLAVVALIAVASAPISRPTSSSAIEVTVFKSPTCGCCKNWVEHLREHAFTVVAKDTSDLTSVKRTFRVPDALQSCHTAFVNGYVVEGHVPAEDIRRMLKEKPKIAGIAVAGMPAGSPGMEMGPRKDAYTVMAFQRDGRTSVYARH